MQVTGDLRQEYLSVTMAVRIGVKQVLCQLQEIMRDINLSRILMMPLYCLLQLIRVCTAVQTQETHGRRYWQVGHMNLNSNLVHQIMYMQLKMENFTEV